MKRIFGWIFLFILLLGGTGLLLYPVWSDWTASRENDRQDIPRGSERHD